MPVNDFLPGDEGKSLRRSFLVTVAGALALVGGMIGLATTRHSLNLDVAQGEQSRVLQSLASLQQQARNKLDKLVQNKSIIDAASKQSADLPRGAGIDGFDRLLVLNMPQSRRSGNDPKLKALEPLLLTLDTEAQVDVTGSIQTLPLEATGLVSLDGDVYSAAAAPLEAENGPAALVGLQRLDDALLSSISKDAGTNLIKIRARDEVNETSSALDIGGTSGKPEFAGPALVWQSERPGDLMVMRWALILAGGAIFIAGMLIWHARRAMRELRLSEERARKLAGYDMLSGLPNRFQFTQLLDQEFARSARGGGAFALLYFDIDRFREVNDLLGHDAGDAVIVGVTARLNGVLRAGDRLARFGADEFAILQTAIASPADTEQLATRVMDSIREPINIGEHQVTVRMSGGIALHPQDAATRQDLMRDADEALTRAKSEGRDRYTFFQKRLSEDMRSRKTTENELRKAIESSGLAVYYQPIMSVDGERVACVEALVRWPHPVRGLVPPDNFIALAEDRGLILPLGEFVLRQACRDGKRWPGVRVAVNVSPIQFRQADFAAMVERILTEEEFDPTFLELELTEGVVIADADQAENVMMDLRALGVRLALDDFGTGYSSLVYLRRFAFDKIKIDRSFLEAMEGTGESAIIVHSIIHLGRQLGLTVTAEGIENAEQHRFLQAAGAHELQGYLFSKPVPAPEIDKILAAQAARMNGEPVPMLRSVA